MFIYEKISKTIRNAYKAFGKSPSEYRNAAEAMLRRIIKGNGLYHINGDIFNESKSDN